VVLDDEVVIDFLMVDFFHFQDLRRLIGLPASSSTFHAGSPSGSQVSLSGRRSSLFSVPQIASGQRTHPACPKRFHQ
jgi:hypothetical protein